MKKKLLLSLFLCVTNAFGVSENLEKNIIQLSKDPYWQRLLHYKRRLLIPWSTRSLVDSPTFFLSEDGASDPAAEMRKTIESFSKDIKIGFNKMHPQCVFPERYRWLKSKLSLNTKSVKCNEFLEWKKRLKTKSVSLIFSSYYANNPASFFGHTFLKLNANENDGSKRAELTDYAIDFSAQTNVDHGIEFAVRGLIGGYPGRFLLKKYYVKVNEYNNNESRDLWEYKLSLNEEQIDRMLNHYWELYNSAWFDYFFLDENCSYQLLSLLEVANLSWELTDGFYLFAIPVDTLKKVIKQKGAVREIKFRPAMRKQMLAKRYDLLAEEYAQYKKIIEGGQVNFDDVSSKTLEAVIALLRYKRFEDKKLENDYGSLLKKLIMIRARKGGVTEKTDVLKYFSKERYRPDRAHESSEIMVGSRLVKGNDAEYSFGIKAALHDLFFKDDGLPKFSKIEITKLELKYQQKSKKIILEEFTPFSILSLNPIMPYDFGFSWMVHLSSLSLSSITEIDCRLNEFYLGGGLNYLLFNRKLSVFSLLLSHVQGARVFENDFTYGAGLYYGLIYNFKDFMKIGFEGKSFLDFNQNELWNKHQRYSVKLSLFLTKNFMALADLGREQFNDSFKQDRLKVALRYFF